MLFTILLIFCLLLKHIDWHGVQYEVILIIDEFESYAKDLVVKIFYISDVLASKGYCESRGVKAEVVSYLIIGLEVYLGQRIGTLNNLRQCPRSLLAQL